MSADQSKMTDGNEEKEPESYTMDELIAKQDSDYLMAQQLEQATQSTINCCQYNNGYIRQDVYSCLDCYTSDTSAYLCYGCIMNCHVECKNVHEMYEKSYVRCDCGVNISNPNNTDRKTCQLDTEQTKQHTVNTENRYTHNNHARYCYCDTEHNDKHIYMTCQLCEDWYHAGPTDTCLHFADGKAVPDDIDESDKTLICKLCMNKPYIDILLPYIATEQQRIKDNTNNSTLNDTNITSPAPKKHRSALDPTTPVNDSNTAAASPSTTRPIVCSRIRDIPTDIDISELKKYDLLTSTISRDLCLCNKCLELYEQHRIKQQLLGIDEVDDDINDSTTDITATPTTATNIVTNHVDGILQQMIARLPVPAAAEMIQKYNNFKQALTDEFSDYMETHQPTVITAEIIKHIFAEATARAAQTTLAHEANPELTQYAE